ncbi:MAG TPA: glycosyltransferase family 2 protein [Candidatus Binataceae bacterium]|nr:glycosyltransferase family 2 protein [Candidatus Binataceae bacterium]
MRTDVSVIILTFNEERNLGHALTSVCGWARQVLVLDSFSTDRTLEVAARFDCQCFQHRFTGYAEQRNYALQMLPITASWILFLDADEFVPQPLAEEIGRCLASQPAYDGYFVRRRFFWMGRWIRRGYYRTWLLRLFRRERGRCEQRGVNEHIVVDGRVGYLRAALIHENHNGLERWIQKHLRYAGLEAAEMAAGHFDLGLAGQAATKRWLARYVWRWMPVGWRAVFYFAWRYLLLGGFLDGRQGLSYHLLQALWFRLVIDLKYLELRSAATTTVAASDGVADRLPPSEAAGPAAVEVSN